MARYLNILLLSSSCFCYFEKPLGTFAPSIASIDFWSCSVYHLPIFDFPSLGIYVINSIYRHKDRIRTNFIYLKSIKYWICIDIWAKLREISDDFQIHQLKYTIGQLLLFSLELSILEKIIHPNIILKIIRPFLKSKS